MSDWVGGALVSEALKLLIAEAKKFYDFKPLSEDLASTMERLIPLTEQIALIQGSLDFGFGELKELMDTIQRASDMVDKCRRGVSVFKKSIRTREIMEINKDLLKFCQTELQFLQYRTLTTLLAKTGNLEDMVLGLNKKVDGLIVSPPPSYKDLCSVPQPVKDLVGFDIPLMELKKKLLDDDSLGSLVVCAPPGCGKTTLVTKLCHDHEVEGKFKHIFYWVVSSTPNLRLMVQHLLLHNGYTDLKFANDSQAANCLRKLLEELNGNGGILLVLDDVWGKEELLLKTFQFDLQGYKILVTSRFEFPSFGPTYHLKPLEPKDAKNLLIQFASPLPHHTNPDEFDNLLNKILKRCNGLPIVIEVVGSSLKERDLNFWKGKVESWSQGDTIIDSSNVRERLQPSFSVLEPQLQKCFKDMGSFLEDQKIRASVIIDLWVELYGKSSTVCMKYLNDLAYQNLLKLIPLGKKEHEDGFYNGLIVTQHDILRELAIHQSRSKPILEKKRLKLEIIKNKFPDWYLNLNQPINARVLSISTDDLFSSKWVEMDCPNVKALILNLSSSDYALPSFIAGMKKKLKVLTITNHGVPAAKIRNFSCLSLLPNLRRIRLEKASVSLLDLPQLRLGSLEKISFVMCSFGDVFYDCVDIDISEAFPSLQEIDIDYCYDLEEVPYWVSEVVSLQRLSITNCYKLSRLPEDIGNLIKLQVLRVSSCLDLRELPESAHRLGSLWFLDISDCTGLRKLPLEIGKLQSLRKMSMRKCYKCELPDSVKNLQGLKVICDDETEFVLWERLKNKMRNLSVHVEETEHNLNLLHML